VNSSRHPNNWPYLTHLLIKQRIDGFPSAFDANSLKITTRSLLAYYVIQSKVFTTTTQRVLVENKAVRLRAVESQHVALQTDRCTANGLAYALRNRFSEAGLVRCFKQRSEGKEQMTTRLDKYPHLLKASPFDVVLVVLIVVASAAFAWPSRPRSDQPASDPGRALIYQDGRLLYQLDLRENRTVTLPQGGIKVLVQHGKVSVIEADCPRQICVHTGAISRPGQVIACVPNKMLIQIKTAAPPFLDAVAN
jgi:hypothetical protein